MDIIWYSRLFQVLERTRNLHRDLFVRQRPCIQRILLLLCRVSVRRRPDLSCFLFSLTNNPQGNNRMTLMTAEIAFTMSLTAIATTWAWTQEIQSFTSLNGNRRNVRTNTQTLSLKGNTCTNKQSLSAIAATLRRTFPHFLRTGINLILNTENSELPPALMRPGHYIQCLTSYLFSNCNVRCYMPTITTEIRRTWRTIEKRRK